MGDNTVYIRRINKRNVSFLEEVFKFRYHIYHRLFKDTEHPGIVHDLQIIRDDLEDFSQTFVAIINQSVVGTIRMTELKYLSKDDCLFKYCNEKLSSLENSVAMSMYCILPEYNNSDVTYQLLKKVLENAERKNITQIYVNAPDYLVPYYNNYQFQACSDKFNLHKMSNRNFQILKVETDVLHSIGRSVNHSMLF